MEDARETPDGTAPPAGHPATTTVLVTGFFHAGVTVRDMEASLRFYRDALQLTVVSDGRRDGALFESVQGISPTSVRVVFLSVPGSEALVELFEYEGIERHPASARPCDYGAGHFCLYVSDAEAAARRIVEHGFRTRRPVQTLATGPNAGNRVVYAIDPDGYHVELFERVSTATG